MGNKFCEGIVNEVAIGRENGKSHSKFGIKLVTQFLDFWRVMVYHARARE